MPNWCDNRVKIVFDDKESVDNFIEKCCYPSTITEGDYHLSFKKMVPLSDNGEWDYELALAKWGTKWEPTENETQFNYQEVVDDGWLELFFSTAWSPAEGIFLFLRNEINLEVSWFYDEPGMCLAGYLEKEV